MHPAASLLSMVGIGGLAVVVAALLVAGDVWAVRRLGVGAPSLGVRLGGWLVLTGGLALAGVLHQWKRQPPPLVLFMIGGVLLAVWLAGSRIGERMAEALPLAAIVGFQAFRLPLELFMHHAAAEGTMPVLMSFSGSNYDIVSGLTAIPVAWLAARGEASPGLVKAWGILSSVLLAVVMALAIGASPALAAFGTGPRELNTFVGYFPFVWLPCVLVPAALFGQIVLFRRLALDVL
ncbi:MAG: hypothetical protein JWP97_4538 [Labilithrix sp.]|nr:hypothetical protein [Labilithrix sp.]